jgi:hypothetical protein
MCQLIVETREKPKLKLSGTSGIRAYVISNYEEFLHSHILLRKREMYTLRWIYLTELKIFNGCSHLLLC